MSEQEKIPEAVGVDGAPPTLRHEVWRGEVCGGPVCVTRASTGVLVAWWWDITDPPTWERATISTPDILSAYAAHLSARVAELEAERGDGAARLPNMTRAAAERAIAAIWSAPGALRLDGWDLHVQGIGHDRDDNAPAWVRLCGPDEIARGDVLAVQKMSDVCACLGWRLERVSTIDPVFRLVPGPVDTFEARTRNMAADWAEAREILAARVAELEARQPPGVVIEGACALGER